MADNWSHREVTITVEAYLDMLADELAGRPINKSAVRRRVLPQLDNRSNGSLEFKNCNISAAMLSLGLPSVDGYKPRWNYQRERLHAVLGEILQSRPQLFTAIEEVVEKSVETPEVFEWSSIIDPDPPERRELYSNVSESEEARSRSVTRNYLEQETRNRSLGLGGEELVLEYERYRLNSLNREKFAARVEHTSVEKGDGAGFDIRSFDEFGNDLFIEVKTTQFRKEAPFFISSNEVSFSQTHADRYALYRVYSFTKNPKLFILPGNISQHCQLTATNFRGSF